jgi:hypothetical protein
VSVVKGDDGLEETKPEQEDSLRIGRPFDAVEAFEICTVGFRKAFLALVQTLFGIRQFGHVA